MVIRTVEAAGLKRRGHQYKNNKSSLPGLTLLALSTQCSNFSPRFLHTNFLAWRRWMMCLEGRQLGRMWTPLTVGYYWTRSPVVLPPGHPSHLSVIDSWLRGLEASFSNRSIIVLFILQRHAQSVSTQRHTLCRCRQDQQTNQWPSSSSVLMPSVAIDGKSSNDIIISSVPPPLPPTSFHRPYPPPLTELLIITLIIACWNFRMTQVYWLSSTNRKNKNKCPWFGKTSKDSSGI